MFACRQAVADISTHTPPPCRQCKGMEWLASSCSHFSFCCLSCVLPVPSHLLASSRANTILSGLYALDFFLTGAWIGCHPHTQTSVFVDLSFLLIFFHIRNGMGRLASTPAQDQFPLATFLQLPRSSVHVDSSSSVDVTCFGKEFERTPGRQRFASTHTHRSVPFLAACISARHRQFPLVMFWASCPNPPPWHTSRRVCACRQCGVIGDCWLCSGLPARPPCCTS